MEEGGGGGGGGGGGEEATTKRIDDEVASPAVDPGDAQTPRGDLPLEEYPEPPGDYPVTVHDYPDLVGNPPVPQTDYPTDIDVRRPTFENDPDPPELDFEAEVPGGDSPEIDLFTLGDSGSDVPRSGLGSPVNAPGSSILNRLRYDTKVPVSGWENPGPDLNPQDTVHPDTSKFDAFPQGPQFSLWGVHDPVGPGPFDHPVGGPESPSPDPGSDRDPSATFQPVDPEIQAVIDDILNSPETGLVSSYRLGPERQRPMVSGGLTQGASFLHGGGGGGGRRGGGGGGSGGGPEAQSHQGTSFLHGGGGGRGGPEVESLQGGPPEEEEDPNFRKSDFRPDEGAHLWGNSELSPQDPPPGGEEEPPPPPSWNGGSSPPDFDSFFSISNFPEESSSSGLPENPELGGTDPNSSQKLDRQGLWSGPGSQGTLRVSEPRRPAVVEVQKRPEGFSGPIHGSRSPGSRRPPGPLFSRPSLGDPGPSPGPWGPRPTQGRPFPGLDFARPTQGYQRPGLTRPPQGYPKLWSSSFVRPTPTGASPQVLLESPRPIPKGSNRDQAPTRLGIDPTRVPGLSSGFSSSGTSRPKRPAANTPSRPLGLPPATAPLGGGSVEAEEEEGLTERERLWLTKQIQSFRRNLLTQLMHNEQKKKEEEEEEKRKKIVVPVSPEEADPEEEEKEDVKLRRIVLEEEEEEEEEVKKAGKLVQRSGDVTGVLQVLPNYENLTALYYDPEYYTGPAFLVYGDYADYPSFLTSPTAAAAAASQMESLYPPLGQQVQLQNQSQSVVNEVLTQHNVVIHFPNGTTDFSTNDLISSDFFASGGEEEGGGGGGGEGEGTAEVTGDVSETNTGMESIASPTSEAATSSGETSSVATISGDSSSSSSLVAASPTQATAAAAAAAAAAAVGAAVGAVAALTASGSGTLSGSGGLAVVGEHAAYGTGTSTGTGLTTGTGSPTGTGTSTGTGLTTGTGSLTGTSTGTGSLTGTYTGTEATAGAAAVTGTGTSTGTGAVDGAVSCAGTGAGSVGSTVTSPAVYSCGGSSAPGESDVVFLNPSFPNHDALTTSCTLRIKLGPNTCQLRVDFETELAAADKGVCKNQFLEFTGTIWPLGFHRICGTNVDQHFYAEVEDPPAGTTTVRHLQVVATSSAPFLALSWYISVKQIDCRHQAHLMAPPGCRQYFTQSSGTLKSFNWEDGQYLVSQHYRICIKARPGACSVTYIATSGEFMIEKYGTIKSVPYDR
ncbi:uncharacterized protein LOC143030354 [Oratosquilla oratoria]|uniref:uncharacterized protein LOC143030354 n=1 Tax=Oratosquilla oratoria TaxID=337810 RepID=UPI003F758063